MGPSQMRWGSRVRPRALNPRIMALRWRIIRRRVKCVSKIERALDDKDRTLCRKLCAYNETTAQ